MKVITVRNVHQALPRGLDLLNREGVRCSSRAGDVVRHPEPVTTVYQKPLERVVHWEGRDYNPAFVLYEALWMLAGRHDTAPLDRYVHDYTSRFSDDGLTQHGAYGYRWTHQFDHDQLAVAAGALLRKKEDRRVVIQMWDPRADLPLVATGSGRDVPCNLTLTLQTDPTNTKLDMVVFCRSNDVIWGAYYANAFHFSMLLEYMANWVGLQVGTYTQVSVNYHAYKEVLDRTALAVPHGHEQMARPALHDPYMIGAVRPTTMPLNLGQCDLEIAYLLNDADSGFTVDRPVGKRSRFYYDCHSVLRAHHASQNSKWGDRFLHALDMLGSSGNPRSDLVASMEQWLSRRHARKLAKEQGQ